MEYDEFTLKKPIILVVDDDAVVRNAARNVLDHLGFAVELAQDGPEALSLIDKIRPDLVMLDIKMPEMDGFEVCAKLRRTPGGDRIPVLMVTGLDDVDSIMKAYEAGATDFVTKPVNWFIIAHRIRYMLRAGNTLDELSKSEAQNRALLNAIPDTMFHINSEGVFLDCKGTPDFLTLVGPDGVSGKKIADIFTDGVSAKVVESTKTALETGEPQIFEHILPLASEKHCFEFRIVVCGERELLVIMRDITERQRLEQALQISETKYRIVAENTTSWEFWLSPEGRFIYNSPSCRTVTGYTSAEFESDSKLFLRIVHIDDLTKCATHCSLETSMSAKMGELEFRLIHRDGTIRWISHVCQGVYDDNGDFLGIRGSNRDITAQKRAAAIVREYEERRIRHEEERKWLLEKDKILKDLHDGIGGIVTNVGLLSELAYASTSPDYVKKSLRTMSELSREAISELRYFMNIIDDRRLDWRAFIADLRDFGSSMIEGNGLSFRVKTTIQPDSLEPESVLCLNIFRIYKEALTNVIKHSKASVVDVNISLKAKRFILAVHDNGVGVTGGEGEGRGIMNMKSRAKEIGGSFSLKSDKGTWIHLDCPIVVRYP